MTRSTTPWIAYLRISIGLLWVFELLVGRWWKIGLTEGPHPGWLGEEAGRELRQLFERVLEQGAAPWVEQLVQQVLIPHAEMWSIALVVLECIFAVSFILGVLVRPVAFVGLIVSFIVISATVTRIYSLFALGHLFLLWTGGGHAFSFDGFVIRRLRESRGGFARFLRAILELRILPRAGLVVIGSLALLASLYSLLQLMWVEPELMKIVHLDLAVLLGLIAIGIFTAHGLGDGTVSVPTDLVRIFLGFKFLQEIFIWRSVDKFALPGWASPASLGEMLESVAANHWPPIAQFINDAVLPHIEYWALGFAIAQTLVGVLLLLGWRSRSVAVIGLIMVLALVVLGFTRMAPFVLVYLLFLVGAGSGRVLALDTTRVGGKGTLMPLPWPAWAGIFTALAAAGLIAFVVEEGIVTDGYHETMPGFIAALLAIPLIALSLAAWFKPRAA